MGRFRLFASAFAWLLLLRLMPAQAEEAAGESLFDDDEVEQFKQQEEQVDDVISEPSPDEVTFSSDADDAFLLGTDLAFDEQGNVKEGGSRFDPDITYWYIAEFNGERINNPTDPIDALLEAIREKKDYNVKFAPPTLGQFRCNEKVEVLERMFEEKYSHEYDEEFLQRSLSILKNEGVVNTKQLGELEEKDYDAIPLPAIIKSRLRKVREWAREQSRIADSPVEMESAEVNDALKEFAEARARTKDGEPAKPAEPVVAEANQNMTAEEEAEDGTFKALVWAVLNCPTCKGKETIACFKTCRYGGELSAEGGKSWSDCLNKCVTNRFLRATLWALLPKEAA